MHRFDLQDWQWALICDLFPANDGKEGGRWRDHRTVLNGMFHVLHAGCPWRDLPDRYGPWQTVFDRFNRYRRDGTFDLILTRLRTRLDKLGRIDWDYWCFDGTNVRAARCAAGAKKPRGTKPSATAAAGSAANCT
jgi:transposase